MFIIKNIYSNIVELLNLYTKKADTLTRQTKIEFIACTVLIGFFVAVVFHYTLASYWGAHYPRDTFILKVIGSEFSDFYHGILTYFLDPYHGKSPSGEYFPFSYVFVYPFNWLESHKSLMLYCIIYSGFMYGFIVYYFSSKSNASFKLANFKNCFILSFMSYPFLFSFERGNLENLLFILVALSIYFYQKESRKLGVIFLAMASAMKLYPLFFIVLFISDKRYNQAAWAVLGTIILTLIALFILTPPWQQNLLDFLNAIHGLNNNCTSLPDRCIQYNVGLWAPLKLIYFRYLSLKMSMSDFSLAYYGGVIIALLVIVPYIIFIEKELWKKLALIVSAILLFPIISNAYKLLYLYIPIAAFVNAKSKPHDLWYLLLFSLLLIPKNYYWILQDISINELLNTAILLCIMLSIVIQGTRLYVKKDWHE